MSELFDERELRRALRLDGDELLSRIDPAAIAVAARAAAPRREALLAMLGAVGATALVAVLVWERLFALLPAAAPGALELAIDAVAAVAAVGVTLALAAAQPVVPASLLAALAVVIAYELVERRERGHVRAS